MTTDLFDEYHDEVFLLAETIKPMIIANLDILSVGVAAQVIANHEDEEFSQKIKEAAEEIVVEAYRQLKLVRTEQNATETEGSATDRTDKTESEETLS